MSRRDRRSPSPQFSAEETAAALALFNAGVERQENEKRQAKRLARADRERKAAAERVKAVDADPQATPETKAEAREAYRLAVEAYNRASRGEDDPAPEEAAETADDSVPEQAADEQAADEQAADEQAADSNEPPTS